MFDGIEFKGITSKSLSIVGKELGRRKRAQETIYVNEVLESDKDFDEHSGKYRPYEREMAFHILDMSKKDAIFSWLKGYGILRTALDKSGFFKASVISDLTVEDDVGLENFLAKFKINPPFFFLDSGTVTTAYTTSPETITNPGTHESEPIIKIVGSGNVNLTVNGKTMNITGISGDITIDSERMTAYNALANQDSKVLGEYPIFKTGANTISWTGSVTRLEVTPNWRNI